MQGSVSCPRGGFVTSQRLWWKSLSVWPCDRMVPCVGCMDGWMHGIFVSFRRWCLYLTSDAKNVSNVGDKDDQQVHSKQQADSNANVANPVERFSWKQQLEEGAADLAEKERRPQRTQLSLNHSKEIWQTRYF